MTNNGNGTSHGILDLPAEQYHADNTGHTRPSLSASIAHTLLTSSPRHAWTQHPRLNPDFERVEEEKFSIGTVAHALLLQGDDVAEPLPFDSWRTNDAKAAREEIAAAGRIPLLSKDYERVCRMVAEARGQIALKDCAPPLFADGVAEPTLVWEDDHGVVCRARLDWLRNDLTAIDDLKTTSASAKPQAWARRTMWSIGADVQIAFYLRGIEKLHGVRPAWRYVVVETYPPFEVSVVEPDAGILEVGRLKVEEAIAKWAVCLENDFWPGYPSTPFRAELPTWVEMEWLEGRDAA